MSRSGVSQEELSGHLGCTQQFVSKVLNGRRGRPEGMPERAKAYLKAKEGPR
jgi:transcriptional regulator with XRE-family HTH domain